VYQTQEMKGKEGAGDLGGPDANSGRYSSRSGLCPSGEKGFFGDASDVTIMTHTTINKSLHNDNLLVPGHLRYYESSNLRAYNPTYLITNKYYSCEICRA